MSDDKDDVLAEEKTFLKENQAELADKYPGKFLLIKGSEVYGDYDTHEEGVIAGVQKFPASGPFLVRSVDDPDDPEFQVPAYYLGIPLSCPPS